MGQGVFEICFGVPLVGDEDALSVVSTGSDVANLFNLDYVIPHSVEDLQYEGGGAAVRPKQSTNKIPPPSKKKGIQTISSEMTENPSSSSKGILQHPVTTSKYPKFEVVKPTSVYDVMPSSKFAKSEVVKPSSKPDLAATGAYPKSMPSSKFDLAAAVGAYPLPSSKPNLRATVGAHPKSMPSLSSKVQLKPLPVLVGIDADATFTFSDADVQTAIAVQNAARIVAKEKAVAKSKGKGKGKHGQKFLFCPCGQPLSTSCSEKKCGSCCSQKDKPSGNCPRHSSEYAAYLRTICRELRANRRRGGKWTNYYRMLVEDEESDEELE